MTSGVEGTARDRVRVCNLFVRRKEREDIPLLHKSYSNSAQWRRITAETTNEQTERSFSRDFPFAFACACFSENSLFQVRASLSGMPRAFHAFPCRLHFLIKGNTSLDS